MNSPTGGVSTSYARSVGPGLALALLVSVVAWFGERLFIAVAGRALLEAIVLAILVGAVVRTAFVRAPARFERGAAFASGFILECSIVLLGAGSDLRALVAAGPAILSGIVVIVGVTLVVGTYVGQWFGLPRTHALLVAVGNAICGNSAISAAAPVVGARRDEVASAIAFTAVLGVVVIVGLPFLIPLLKLSDTQYGVVAGLTVYAVPQVIAAAYPVSVAAGQAATLVKLTRVLLLGPVVLILSLTEHHAAHMKWWKAVPWYIIGFGIAAALRTTDVIPASAGDVVREGARLLTVLAMAGLGLAVDLQAVRRVGARVGNTVLVSLVLMLAMSLALVRLLRVA
ncbi:MAG: putative sulfate exporter family transporter [Gemmatimonadaceae bacterium]|nr:putative sulfate exporter family transporter [Gemmatimonadaceae bacterium]